MKNENRKKSILESSAVLALYAVLWILISFFHEPWFDEAQAWQIARCASIKDILFSIPHYEGHPPLWHLILAIPAKLGVPYELGLKSVGFFFSFASAALIIFKAPFPKWIRFSLPFSYFPFYQYGIVVRPYSVMLLAFLLAAITFPHKNDHPWKFVLCLMLLCLTSAYGILFAGGITVAWLIDLYSSQTDRKLFFKMIKKEKFFYPLLSLLFLAIILIIEIIPYKDTMAVNPNSDYSPLYKRILYCFLAMPADAAITNILPVGQFINNMDFPSASLVSSVIVGIVIFICIFYTSDGKKWTYFFLPHVLFAFFSSIVYSAAHHTGLDILLMVFWIWIAAENQNQFKLLTYKSFSPELHENNVHKIKSAVTFLAVLSLLISLYWSVSACITDIRHNYSEGREVSSFLKENGLSDLKIMCPWEVNSDEESDSVSMDTNFVGNAVTILPYFDKNIILNLNNGSDSCAYLTHKRSSQEENEHNFEKWMAGGFPDIIVNVVDMETLTGNKFDIYQYQPVYRVETQGESIWKNKYRSSSFYIFMRKDLLEQYHLEPLRLDMDFAMSTGLLGFVYPEYLKIVEAKYESEK